MVVVCATTEQEAQTWQRNERMEKATFESGKTDAGKGDTQPDTIAIKLDSDEYEVKDKLDQLYEVIRKKFGLTARRSTTWEQKRDSFIQSIASTARLPPNE